MNASLDVHARETYGRLVIVWRGVSSAVRRAALLEGRLRRHAAGDQAQSPGTGTRGT